MIFILGEIYSDLAETMATSIGRQCRFIKIRSLQTVRKLDISLCLFSELAIIFLYSASEGLEVVYRGSDRIVVRFVPVYGESQYYIVARSTEAGPFKGKCDTSSHTCDISGLRPSSSYTLWLRSCERETFLLCDLRAVPLDVITHPEG